MKTILLAIFFTLPVSTLAFAQQLPTDLARIIDKLDSECAGNSNGYVGTFDPSTYSDAKVLKKLKAAKNGQCRSNFSSSKAEGTERLLHTLFYFHSPENRCVMSTLSIAERNKLRSMIVDPTNLGVFSKEWDGDSGDSEYCSETSYYIYRADGVVVNILFNHTD